ncbi:glycosyltransferase family 2 protein [Lysinibacter cavernae]|uniref:N-acetylglucosaminyl-diphospho-decaprenol L-rhamnosyltransferase n=1 Tax=Lysinibacter cavernae TaxID=1640652 RepID=A0A7X5R3S5_9MICO|nr:glycosyltransferase family 2 protein [Lysinibacter cavernae]NIH55108.1 N-acetylglucosaminyl-diphospho-decaprenol L-rhamnosyltransferase [Lysinibacter cavernae]
MSTSHIQLIPDSVVVITVSYGSADALVGLYRSLRDAYGSELRVVTADNKPGDTATEKVAAEFSSEYLPMPSNLGYGTAVNRAVEASAADAEWIFVCNPDLVITPGTLESLLNVATADPKIAVVGPKILQPDGTTYPSARMVPSLRTGIGHALFANIWKSNPWSAKYHQDASPEETRETGWLSGACLLIRRTAFSDLNGFDEQYFMYFEDVDLGYRFSQAGYRNVYVPEAVVTHTGGHSTQSNSSSMLNTHHESAIRFLNTRYSRPLFFPLRWALTIGLKVRAWFGRKVGQ